MAKTAQIDKHAPRRADAVDEIIGGRLRALRSQRGLSQAALAEAIGVSFQQLQKYEHGRNRLSCSTMLRAADALGVSPTELLPYRAHAAPARTTERPGEADQYLARILADFDKLSSAQLRAALLNVVRKLADEAPARSARRRR